MAEGYKNLYNVDSFLESSIITFKLIHNVLLGKQKDQNISYESDAAQAPFEVFPIEVFPN